MISIIIPVYNGAKHINNCYESLISQSYKDWEAVFINDGSKDESVEILNSFARNDSRLKVISQSNSGVAVAREVGIKNAEGEYITFLDVDDLLPPEALSIFIDGMLQHNADIVVGGMALTSESITISEILYKTVTLTGNDFFDNLCTGKIRWQLWGKAYRRALFDNIVTPAGLISGEDMAVCAQVAVKAKKVYIDSRIVYEYMQNENSVTHSKNHRLSIDSIKSAKLASREISAEYYSDNFKVSIDSLFLLCLSSALYNGINVKEDLVKYIMENHMSMKALSRIPPIKRIPILFLKIFHFNMFFFR